MDWCGLIVHCLAECKNGWVPGNPRSLFTGPLTVLALLYVDATNTADGHLMRTRPTLIGWTTELLKTREAQEIRNCGFGNFDIDQSFQGPLNMLFNIVNRNELPVVDVDDAVSDTHPTDVEGFIQLVEVKLQQMERLKDEILSYMNGGLSLDPNNQHLKDLKAQLLYQPSERITKTYVRRLHKVGAVGEPETPPHVIDDQDVLDYVHLFDEPDVVEENQAGGASLNQLPTDSLPSPSFHMDLTPQMDNVAHQSTITHATVETSVAGAMNENPQVGRVGKRVAKASSALCSPYFRRQVSVEAKVTAGEFKIVRSLFAMLGDLNEVVF